MQMTKTTTLPLQECMTKTLPLTGVPVPNATVVQMQTLTQTQNLITTSLTPTRPMSIEAKHPYTTPEATYQFTVQVVNQIRKTWMSQNYLRWKPKFLYYINLKEFLSHHPTMSLLFPQHPLQLLLSMPSLNLMASRTSRSPISMDTFYLIPLWTLLCLQHLMTQMTKTIHLQEYMTKTLPLQECLYPTPPSTNADDNLDAESDHNFADLNEANDNSSKASIHSTKSNLSIHSVTSESPQHPPDEENNLSEEQPKLDDVELPKLETHVPVLH